jgi:hypothetical protein
MEFLAGTNNDRRDTPLEQTVSQGDRQCLGWHARAADTTTSITKTSLWIKTSMLMCSGWRMDLKIRTVLAVCRRPFTASVAISQWEGSFVGMLELLIPAPSATNGDTALDTTTSQRNGLFS